MSESVSFQFHTDDAEVRPENAGPRRDGRIVGFRRAGHVDALAGAAELELDAATVAALDGLS
jgi:hypothetical protein